MKIFWMTIFVLGISISCSKSLKCWDEDKNEGIIESSIRIDCEPATEQQEFIIKNDSTFNQIFTNSVTGKLNFTLPVIDFSNNSLLGLFTTGSCEVKYI